MNFLQLGWRSVFFGLLVLVSVAYARSLTVPFHFDDEHTIVNNAGIHGLSNLRQIWTDVSASSQFPDNRIYRPLTFTVFALCWAVGGGSVWPFHVVKIFMHAVVCLMFFLIWRRLWKLPGWFPVSGLKLQLFKRTATEVTPDIAALLLAVIFAVHPVSTEIVDYVCANTSLQCAMFYLMAFWMFLRFMDEGRPRLRLWSLLFFAFSVLSKEEGITLPAIAVVTTFFLQKGGFVSRAKAAVRASWPYWLAALALLLLIRAQMPHSVGGYSGNVAHFDYFITQWRAYLWYMKLWFWPWDLNADNTGFGFSNSLSDPRVVQALIGNLLLVLFSFWNRKRFPSLFFGLIWYYITISPASSLVPLSEPVNERRMYLAYAGFAGGTFCFILWFLSEGLKAAITPRAMTAGIAILLIGFVIGTENRIGVWKDDEMLWADTVEKNPTNGRAMNNLALIYMRRAEYPKALALLENCERSWPTYFVCPLNKGIIYTAQRNFAEAETSLNRAVKLDPNNLWIHFRIGQLREAQKDYPGAIQAYEKADRLSGEKYVEAKTRVGEIALLTGDRELAQKVAAVLMRLDPGDDLVRSFLGKLQGAPR